MDSASDAAFRLAHVGGSEASALVGLSPRDTPWSLYQKKVGNIPPDDFSQLGDRQRWGLNLERAVLNELQLRLGYDIRKWTRAPLSNGTLGGHPDGRRVVSNQTRAIVEIKTTDWMIWKDQGEQPPDHHIVQLQTYMGLAGGVPGILGTLVGGNDLVINEYEFRPRLFELLDEKARRLFELVRAKTPPPVNFEADREAINEIFRSAGGVEVVDLTGDNGLTDAMETYVAQSAIEKAAKDAKATAAAEIKYKAGDADQVICGDWSVKFSTTDPKPDVIVTADMVGDTLKGRAGSRSINAPRRIKR